MRFDLTDLRLFLAVIEAGSITHGAARANMALPSASERLSGMEAECGTALLRRGRRGVAPTRAGEALAHHARLILSQMERLRGELGEFAGGRRGTVRLQANTAAISIFLPPALGPWLAANPLVDIDLQERLSTDIVTAVAQGQAEIGIIADSVDAGGLQLLPFALDQLVLAVPPGHVLATAQQVALAEVPLDHMVGLGPDSALQRHMEAQAARLGLRPSYRVRLPDMEGVCRLVADGVGLAILPERAVRRCSPPLMVQMVRLADGWARRRLLLCVRDAAALPPLARDLLAQLTRAGEGMEVEE